MNTQFDALSERIDNIEEKINQFLKAYSIDKQQFIKGTNIKPGIGTKVAYDSNGLIISSEDLTQSDIPSLDIDKINGLQDSINSKANESELDKIRSDINNIHHHTDAVQTGTKVNVDKNGHVIGVSDLTQEDVPVLPIEKIDGLIQQLQELKSRSTNVLQKVDNFSTIPGTGCKVTYDKYGRVIKSDNLSMEDVPSALISQINKIESTASMKASQIALDEIKELMYKKLDANKKINSGTFTKVTVDVNGLVTDGGDITKDDLPEFCINDIKDLRRTLANKLDLKQLEDLNRGIEDLRKIAKDKLSADDIKSKANKDDVHALELKVLHLEEVVNNVLVNIPGDAILKQLDVIATDISTLSGRIAVLEHKLDIDEGV